MADFIRIHTREDGMRRLINVKQIENINDYKENTESWPVIHMVNGDRFACHESFDEIMLALDSTDPVTFVPMAMDEIWDSVMQKID